MEIKPPQVNNLNILAGLGLQTAETIGAGLSPVRIPPKPPEPVDEVEKLKQQIAAIEAKREEEKKAAEKPKPTITPEIAALMASTPGLSGTAPTELPAECCAKCKFYNKRVVPGGNLVIGGKPNPAEEIDECRRYPPNDNLGRPAFTRVLAGNWCGEFAPDRVQVGILELSGNKWSIEESVRGKNKEPGNATNDNGGGEGVPTGMGENLRKRGRPRKKVQASGEGNQDEKTTTATSGDGVQEHPQGV